MFTSLISTINKPSHIRRKKDSCCSVQHDYSWPTTSVRGSLDGRRPFDWPTVGSVGKRLSPGVPGRQTKVDSRSKLPWYVSNFYDGRPRSLRSGRPWTNLDSKWTVTDSLIYNCGINAHSLSFDRPFKDFLPQNDPKMTSANSEKYPSSEIPNKILE